MGRAIELITIEGAVELETADKMAKLGDDHEMRDVSPRAAM